MITVVIITTVLQLLLLQVPMLAAVLSYIVEAFTTLNQAVGKGLILI